MAQPRIDRDKLRTALRKLGDEHVYYMLDEALELIPPAELANLVRRYIDLKHVGADIEQEQKGSVLDAAKTFERASLRGDYHESFNVNSKNYMEKSKGTRAWIAECHRLLDHCLAESRSGDPSSVCATFEIVFGLLRRIDQGNGEVIFLADEAGSWQVGVDWDKVLPAWFVGLAATAEPEEYAQKAVDVIDAFEAFRREEHLKVAHRIR